MSEEGQKDAWRHEIDDGVWLERENVVRKSKEAEAPKGKDVTRVE